MIATPETPFITLEKLPSGEWQYNVFDGEELHKVLCDE